jgi:hypothetical protein
MIFSGTKLSLIISECVTEFQKSVTIFTDWGVNGKGAAAKWYKGIIA